MYDIFISYASEDRNRARDLARILKAQGWTVFWDRESIAAGQDFEIVLENELETAQSVVVLWSDKSAQSKWVRGEARRANKRNVLIPLLLDHTELPMALDSIQAVDLTTWQGESSHESITRLQQALSQTQPPVSRPISHPEIQVVSRPVKPNCYPQSMVALPSAS